MENISTEQILESVKTESASPGTPAEGQAPAAPSPWWQEKLNEGVEYTIEGGKKINEPLEMILKRAGMGYHYAQKMHQVNSQMEQFKQSQSQIEALKKWEEYDAYAKQNPEWAKHVESTWNSRQNLQQSNQANPEIAELKKQFEEQSKFLNELKSSREQEQSNTQYQSFAGEIETVGKSFGVDLTQADEYGRSIEFRVLERMKELGLDGTKQGHFTAAFKDYYHDTLVGRQKEQAIEQHAKKQAELKKAGIREISRTPKGQGSLDGYKPGMNASQVREAALAHLNTLKAGAS